MRILIITDYLPYPPISGDTIRVYNIIRRISSNNELYLLALFGSKDMPDAILHMREFCKQVEVFNHAWPNPINCLPGFLRYLIEGKPIDLRLLYSKELANKVNKLTSYNKFDIVQIEHSRMAFYREYIDPKSQSLSAITFHNIAADQYARISLIQKGILSKLRAWLFSRQLRRWEPGVAGEFTRCITVSDIDRKTLLASNPALKLEVIPNGTDTKKYQLLEMESNVFNLLFIGSMNYPPCVDAVIYFSTRILPIIQIEIPDVHLWIVGNNPSLEVQNLTSDHIHVTGFVESVIPYYQQTAVVVVPLRAGGGTRLKILEAMTFGRPVVSTKIGCEGLDVINGQHLFIADTPEEFSEGTIRLLKDKKLSKQIVCQARKLVEQKYDWDQISEKLLSVYTDMVQEREKRRL